ncbi:MAG TPA: hypothetical protein RMH85_30590 [Polyangiaceae bacterium LLY-WYZ-15_(1-7)]|nr:hypothetical protein [Myxococcales bacterium]MAT26313.1 hypothetical protein [Sandaracinus sp.]HJK90090.1 hypothetical protein [Polyangiaceae bacterium LLY-WYZ-15_(1-7)]MBJ70086.1 hypothetical protein [Sandaracinus sp.]HJL02304.1 hypothetical protein [Polyangiaceae bacterium LLY-WYZ-15_(1-7)]
MSGRLFDAYLVVDWSARSQPSPLRPAKDAIWIGSVERGAAPALSYHRTRADATAALKGHLEGALARGRRVLVGVDFALGYPAGFAAAIGARGWRGVHARLAAGLHDDARNGNDRFALAAALNAAVGPGPGPFWGCPKGARGPHLGSTRAFTYPHQGLARLRVTDARLPGVQEVWKLLGVGSVGSQSLVGIPRVRALRRDRALRGAARLWPFETRFADALPREGPLVLFAEVWPSLLERSAPTKPSPRKLPADAAWTRATKLAVRGLPPIRDAWQVAGLAEWLAEWDEAGELEALLAGPPDLDRATRRRCVREEGWILGA